MNVSILMCLFILAVSQEETVAQVINVLPVHKLAPCLMTRPTFNEIMMCQTGMHYSTYSSSSRLRYVCGKCLTNK